MANPMHKTSHVGKPKSTSKSSRRAVGGVRKVAKRFGPKPNVRRFSKTKDEAERKKIAATFDVAAYAAATDRTESETAKAWATRY